MKLSKFSKEAVWKVAETLLCFSTADYASDTQSFVFGCFIDILSYK